MYSCEHVGNWNHPTLNQIKYDEGEREAKKSTAAFFCVSTLCSFTCATKKGITGTIVILFQTNTCITKTESSEEDGAGAKEYVLGSDSQAWEEI